MMQSAGEEALRQRYLAAMGITPWLPTRALPGAAPSPRWQWQALAPEASEPAATPPAAAPSPPPQAPKPPRARVDVKALLATAGPEAEPAETRPEPPVEAVEAPLVAAPPTTPSHPAAIPRFRLWIQRTPRCLVITDLPLDPQQPVTPQHQRLLQAILAAVNLGGEEAVGGILSWPMFAPESGHDQGLEVARLMLGEEAGLAALPAEAPLLLLGEQAALLLGEPSDGTAGGGLRITGPSLNEMLRIPARKAELWRQLHPLRAR